MWGRKLGKIMEKIEKWIYIVVLSSCVGYIVGHIVAYLGEL